MAPVTAESRKRVDPRKCADERDTLSVVISTPTLALTSLTAEPKEFNVVLPISGAHTSNETVVEGEQRSITCACASFSSPVSSPAIVGRVRERVKKWMTR